MNYLQQSREYKRSLLHPLYYTPFSDGSGLSGAYAYVMPGGDGVIGLGSPNSKYTGSVEEDKLTLLELIAYAG